MENKPPAGPAYVPVSTTPVPPPSGPAVVPVVQKIIFEHPRRSRWIFWLVVLLLIGSVLYSISLHQRYARYFSPEGKLTETFFGQNRLSNDKVAIIRVEGAIFETDGYIKRQIEQVAADSNVKAVVLRVDSPGGTMVASDYLYHELKKLADNPKRKLPLVCSMGGVAASGGYYLAMAVGDRENSIYAEPTTWCGSIGVVIPHYNVVGFMEEHKIVDDSIQSNPLKSLGSFTRKMSEEERSILQGLVDQGFRRFKDVVMAGRPALATNPEALDAVATGAVFTTADAIEKKLVDREGFLEDAVQEAIRAAGLKPTEVRVVQYERPDDVLSQLLSAESTAGRTQMERLAEIATPRAYYMWSLLPGWENLTSGGR